MASGILYTGNLALANQPYTTYMAPSTTYTVCNVSLTNTGTTSVTIRLYIGASLGTQGSPTGSLVNSEAIEYDTVIPAKGVFERTGLVLNGTSSSKYITVLASVAAAVNVNIYGIETSTV
jgi:hypothetical protein